MTQCTATFETGVNGNNISTGDAGSATAFDAVTLGNGTGTGIAKYSSAQAATGTLSGLLGGTGGTGKGYVIWSTAFGTVTDHYGRLYLYLTANPAGQISIMQVGTSGGDTRGARLDINTSGKLAGFDNPAAALFTTFTNSIALNQWVRIEWHIIHSTTVGQAEIKLFNTASSTSPTETQTGTANKNTLANATGIQFGLGVAGAADGVGLYMDNIVAGAAAYPGPVADSTYQPGFRYGFL